MNPVSKRFISISLVSVLGLHFAALFICSSPLTIHNPQVNFIAKTYTGPFFRQNWNLFVPAPKSQHYLFVRYKNKGSWTGWKDILGNCVENNRQNKFSGNEALVLLFSNSLIYFLNKVPSPGLYRQAPAFMEFKVLNHELSRYLALQEKLKVGQEYEVLIYSKEPGSHKSFYIQSLSVNK